MNTVSDVVKYLNSLSCDRCLLDRLSAYTILIWRVAHAARIDVAESVSEFCISMLAGEQSEVEVPRRLALHKLGGWWMSDDAIK